MQLKLAKIISIITTVPMFALFTILFIHKNTFIFNDVKWLYFCIIFLTLIPISSYFIQNFIPSIKAQGREGERKLAFIFGVLSYILGTILAFYLNAPYKIKIIFLSYLLSSIVLTFINKVIKIKASSHACGVSGPLTFTFRFIGYKTLIFSIALPLTWWARLKMNRHTSKELVIGTFVGIFSTLAVLIILNG